MNNGIVQGTVTCVTDNNSSVLEIIASDITINVDKKRVTKRDKKHLELKPPFQLIINDGVTLIEIQSEPLRRFIWAQMDDQTIIQQRHIYGDTDDIDTKQTKDRGSVFPIENAIIQWSGWFDSYGSNVFDQIYERFESICDDITAFGNMLLQQRDVLQEEASNAFDGGLINFSRLFFALRQPDLRICVSTEGQLISGEIQTVEYEPASMFNGAYLLVKMKIYVNDGKSLKGTIYRYFIPEYEGYKDIFDLGIIQLTDEVKQSLIARGHKYIEITGNPTYLSYTGVVTRRSYFSNNTYRAAGRVMVDLQAMRSIDPNYNKYFAIDRSPDNRDSNATLEITDELLMSISPYVYGFSFNAKVWGKMVVDELSTISFRKDAYDMLVLPSDIKVMLSSLVESNEIIGKDFIDGKGGGCIFLLAGSPGCGKL